jgi:hypothetical protein
MTPQYLTDEEILTAACVIPSDLIASSGRVPTEYALMIQEMHEDGVDVCMVVWLDDTIAFMSYKAGSKAPPASHIISAYREHHHLPPFTTEAGSMH